MSITPFNGLVGSAGREPRAAPVPVTAQAADAPSFGMTLAKLLAGDTSRAGVGPADPEITTGDTPPETEPDNDAAADPATVDTAAPDKMSLDSDPAAIPEPAPLQTAPAMPDISELAGFSVDAAIQRPGVADAAVPPLPVLVRLVGDGSMMPLPVPTVAGPLPEQAVVTAGASGQIGLANARVGQFPTHPALSASTATQPLQTRTEPRGAGRPSLDKHAVASAPSLARSDSLAPAAQAMQPAVNATVSSEKSPQINFPTGDLAPQPKGEERRTVPDSAQQSSRGLPSIQGGTGDAGLRGAVAVPSAVAGGERRERDTDRAAPAPRPDGPLAAASGAASSVAASAQTVLPMSLVPFADALSQGRAMSADPFASRDDAIASTSVAAPTERGTHAPQAPAANAEQARQVAQQLVASVTTVKEGVTEITLRPDELGRVSLRLSGNEAAMTVLLTAERPETADLMRRHLDVLTQEFRALGYTNLTFAFGGGSGQNAQPDSGSQPEQSGEPHRQDAQQARPLAPARAGLDLRM